MSQEYRRTKRVSIPVFIILACAVMALLASTPVLAGPQSGAQTVDVLEGLDPVMLAQGKEVQGELKISSTRGRFRYLFASEENKALFEKDPSRFEIQLDGHCARMGAPVGANPDLYSVYKGQIYIFGSETCKKRFDAAPEDYLGSRAPRAAISPEAAAKGTRLIEKAIAALGGADRLSTLKSYREESSVTENRQSGPVQVKRELTILFPGQIRIQETRPDWNDPSVMRNQTMVLSGNDGFIAGARGVLPMSQAHHAVQAQELFRLPIAIFRARSSASLHAASVGAIEKGEVKIEQIEIELNGSTCILGIDNGSGRILTLSYARRGPDGKYGKYMIEFSDYRTVKGIVVPFRIAASFDGRPWPEQSAAIHSVAIDETVSPSQFEKPAQGVPR